MKKTYKNPEITLTMLGTEDIMSLSTYEISVKTAGDGDLDYLDFSALMNQ